MPSEELITVKTTKATAGIKKIRTDISEILLC